MPIQSTDTLSTITFAATETWVIKAGVVVAVSAGEGVHSDYAFSVLLNQGMISGTTAIQFGTATQNAFIENGASGYIFSASTAITAAGQSTKIVNHGAIAATSYAVELVGLNSDMSNYGQIDGFVGVQLGDTCSLYNEGTISGQFAGVLLGYVNTTTVSVQNSGVIRGQFVSIQTASPDTVAIIDNSGALIGDLDLAGGPSAVRNTGTISGDIHFYTGADRFDGRGGAMSGDVLGHDGNDRLIAGAGDDGLWGESGADTLKGSAGDDTLTGGGGVDALVGGKGDDLFVFAKASESKPTGFDLISGWAAGDLIDVSAIDASTALAGQQHLAFGGQVAPGALLAKGKIQYFQEDGHTTVVADVTGDKVADFQIEIAGLVTFTAADFVL